jgi:hypothetical protein
MTDEPKNESGSMALAIVAGFLLLGTAPVAFALLLMLPAHGMSHLELLANLFNEAGSWAYAIILAGTLGSALAAVLMGVSVRRPGMPAPFALAPSLLVWLAALAGTALSMTSMREAVMHASPLDRATILLAGTGEVSSLRVFAFAWSGAAAMCLALASLIALAAPGRTARVVTLLASGALALALAAAMLQSYELRESLVGGARANPADRATLLMASVHEYLMFGRLSNGLLLAAVAIAGAGAAVLSARGKQQAGIGLAASLIICAVGVRGLGAICERQLAGPHDASPPAPPPLAFEGLYPSDDHWESLETGTDAEIDRSLSNRIQFEGNGDEHPRTSVQLPGDIRSASVLRILQVSRSLNVARVELIGGLTRKLEVPPPFEPAAELMATVPQATQVEVSYEIEDCECVGTAKWSAAGLEVTAKDGKVSTWAPAKPDAIASVIDVKRLDFEWTDTLRPIDLVRASLTALSRGHLLVVKVPEPKDPPERR